MPKVAIGLFENPAAARNIVSELESSGMDGGGIRMTGEPISMTEDESHPGMTTAHTAFELDLVHDLTAMGVQQDEAQMYREGVRRGGVLVTAKGSDEQVDAAAERMNRAGALHVEELVRRPAARGAGSSHVYEDISDLRIGGPDVQAGRVRYSSGGARVFVW